MRTTLPRRADDLGARTPAASSSASEPSYARAAFLNPYNLSLLIGLLCLGALTGHQWLIVVAAALELLWMIFAPDSRLLRRWWFDRTFERLARQEAEERRLAKINALIPADRARAESLVAQKETIERLARDNPSLAVDLLQDELRKLDELIEELADLATSAARAESHAQTFDFAQMHRSWKTHEATVKAHPPLDPRRAVAEKNLAVLNQRRARYDDLCRAIQVARGQMDLIEQTFRLLGDEILTMASPRELGGRIDELRIAIDAVRETANEVSGLDRDIITETETEDATLGVSRASSG